MRSQAFVVDASVALKWFSREREDGVESADLLIGVAQMKTTTLAVYEIGARLARGRESSPEMVSRSLEQVLKICGQPIELEPADHLRCAALAREHGLTFYDASYVAIAERLGRRVISADRDLLEPGLAVDVVAALEAV